MARLIDQIDEIIRSNPNEQIISMINPIQWLNIIDSGQYPIVEDVYKSLRTYKEHRVISRNDIFSTVNIQERMVKAMMWAFPENIEESPVEIVLGNLPRIEELITKYIDKDLKDWNFLPLYGKLKAPKGIGDTTLGIILYFCNIKYDGRVCVPITSHVKNSFRKFAELDIFAQMEYLSQVCAVNAFAKEFNLDAEQIEYYLFRVDTEELTIIEP